MGFSWHIVNVVRLSESKETMEGIEGIPVEFHDIIKGTRGSMWATMFDECKDVGFNEDDEFTWIGSKFCENVIQYEPNDDNWDWLSIKEFCQFKEFCRWFINSPSYKLYRLYIRSWF